MSTFGIVVLTLVLLAAVVGIFILLRELFLWYWKINDIIKLLQSIDKKLDNLPKPYYGVEP